MKKKIATIVKVLLQRLSSSLKRFPETILFAFLTVLVLICFNHLRFEISNEAEEILVRLAMTFALGIPVTLCIKTLFERIPHLKPLAKTLTYLGAIGGLIIYYSFFLRDFEMTAVTRYIALSIALYLSFTFIPYFYKKENYELYGVKLFASFFVTYLYSMVLFLGLAAILFTIDSLFSLDIPGKLYLDLWLIVAGIFAPVYFLADIPSSGEEVSAHYYPKVIKVMLLYIVMPLLIAYSAILYAYFVKIIVTRQWPEGMVSHLVLWFSFISILVLFFIYPLRRENQWVQTFTCYFPKLIIPLLLMMFLSMGIRVKTYGITENRYFVLATGLWVTANFIYHGFKKNANNVFLSVSLALVAILTVTGPWSAYSVSKYSQNQRFENILERHGMVSNKTLLKTDGELMMEDKREISAIIRYFNRYHSLKDMKYLPEDFTLEDMEKTFGFEYDYYREYSAEKEYFNYYIEENEILLGISEYDYFADLTLYNHMDFSTVTGPYIISYHPGDMKLTISKTGQNIYSMDLNLIIHRLCNNLSHNGRCAVDQMSYTDVKEGVGILYIFKNINGSKDIQSDELDIRSTNFYLFITEI